MPQATTKIAVYSITDLKNISDDAIPTYLRSKNFRQHYRDLDIRLTLGYTAVALAALTLLLDWRLGFERTKAYTTIIVLVYCTLNALLTYRIWFLERGVIYQGEVGRQEVVISSRTEKLMPTYHLNIKCRDLQSSSVNTSKWHEFELSASFSQWFTVDGIFIVNFFHNWLGSTLSKLDLIQQGRIVDENRSSKYGLGKDASRVNPDHISGKISDSTMRSRRKI